MLLSIEVYEVRRWDILVLEVLVIELIESMPLAWDRRYYRCSEHHGLELQLLKRGTASGRWAVVLPDGSVQEVKVTGNTRKIRPTALTTVMYTTSIVLTEDRKLALLAEADRLITARTISLLPDFGSNTGDAGLSLRRFLGVLASFPMTASGWCRWCLRSRRRFAGGVAVIFFFYEGLTSPGVFDWINGRV